MKPDAIDKAVDILLAARTGARIRCLPDECRPKSIDEAHTIQDALLQRAEAPIGGWKVNAPAGSHIVTRGALERGRMFESPAVVLARSMGIMGVEGELAFRFPEGLPPRTKAYDRAEIAAATEVLPALDLVDSRFEAFMQVTMFERIADGLNLGGFVSGPPLSDWQHIDLAGLRAVLMVDGKVVSEHRNSHPAGDPLAPAVAFANILRARTGVPAGHVMTTGSCTGLMTARQGQTIRAEFDGVGAVQVSFT